MLVNANKPDRWKADIAQSIDIYNAWFLRFAPQAFRETRVQTTERVLAAFEQTRNLTNITPEVFRQNPAILETLRMTTAPPLARDRLIGLAGVSPNLVRSIELHHRMPQRMSQERLISDLHRLGKAVKQLADIDILPWLKNGEEPTETEVYRAATVVADRLCGAVANPIIRNAQERRQLALIASWLDQRGYRKIKHGEHTGLRDIQPGTYGFRMNVPVTHGSREVNVPIDVLIMPRNARQDDLPLLVEAKSAGDFTNTNKRRKEEATKAAQLRKTYGASLHYVLFLCGYFDSGYLGYEAAEGIDWVWEHRIDDFTELGL